VGFDGQFNFENIGDNYTENHVPYVGMRALPAILGSLTVPIVYGIMKESGYGTVIAAFSASIVLFGMYEYIFAAIKLSLYFCIFSDNAHVAQSRLILLDATLIFFLSLTMYSYVRFRKLRYLYVQKSSHLPKPSLTAL
jgi:dolichyl-phosphate-mannose-protein mannosyltransferase